MIKLREILETMKADTNFGYDDVIRVICGIRAFGEVMNLMEEKLRLHHISYWNKSNGMLQMLRKA